MTIFEEFARVNFETLPEGTRFHLVEAAKYADRAGGIPVASACGTTGAWLAEAAANPHRFTRAERAVLMCLPGFTFGRTRYVVQPEGRAELYARLVKWAKYPTMDVDAVRERRRRNKEVSNGTAA